MKKNNQNDSLFTVELPECSTKEELVELKQRYPKYDLSFIASACVKECKEKFERLWKNYKKYADSYFLSEIKYHFHQRTWEMYIGNVLLNKKQKIESKDEGPDFIINNQIYVECVAPTKGELSKPDSVPEMVITNNLNEIQVQDVPVDQMILRITQAIKDKALDQYKKWRKKLWFDSQNSFIIAINTGDLGHVENSSMPNVIKALFGFQYQQINIKTGVINFSYRNEIKKINNASVPVNYFVNPEFSFVSGVLFSHKTVSNHPQNIGEDCIFVNNPFADNPVDDSFVELFKNWIAIQENDGVDLKKNY